MRLFERRGGVPDDVHQRADLPRGERVLAHTVAGDGTWLLGTRTMIAIVPATEGSTTTRTPWERIEDANWDQQAARLRVTEIGTFGQQRPAYDFDLEDPVLFLQLVRERVTASIVWQRRVPVRDQLGLTVIGRRSPVGGPVTWMHAYDAGLDPDAPEVAAVAEQALMEAQAEVGDPADDPI